MEGWELLGDVAGMRSRKEEVKMNLFSETKSTF